jgi:hypothetical protein
MDWTQVLTIVGANIILIIGMLGTFVALYIHSDSKMNANLKAIQDETIIKEARETQKEADQKMFQEIAKELDRPNLTPFERITVLGSIYQIPAEKEKK